MIRKIVFDYYRYLKVCEYFLNNNNNTSGEIAKYYNIHLHEVNHYLDVYLSLKANYMGKPVRPPSSLLIYKNQKKL